MIYMYDIIIIIFIILVFIISQVQYIESFSSNPLPKIIFMYWNDKTLKNNLIRKNIEHIKEILPDGFQLRVYNEENIIDEGIDKKYIKQYSHQHFADYVRLFLLKKYGGLWLDSSIICKNFNFLLDFYKEYEDNPFDVCLYEFKGKNYIENWFILAPQNSIFIRDFYEYYVTAMEIGFAQYKKVLQSEGVNLDSIFYYPEDVYLMQHAIIRRLKNMNKYNIRIKDAEDSMWKIHNKNNWQSSKIADDLINNPDIWKQLYAVKLVEGNRDHLQKQEDIDKLFSNMTK
jgi:Capsular polysaccharide synthesis protein